MAKRLEEKREAVNDDDNGSEQITTMSEPRAVGGHDGAADEGGPGGLELAPEEMRRLGYRVVDHLVDRWQGLGEAPAWRHASREEMEARFMEPAPEKGSDPEKVLERARDIVSVAGRIDHPRFFAFVPSSPTWPGILADFLAGGSSLFQGTWLESAGPSEVELVVLEWFRRWMGLPEGSGGLFTSGGSAANLIAMVAARVHAGEPERPAVYVSDQMHSSVRRAARIAGIPSGAIRQIATGDDYRLDPRAVSRAIVRDLDDGVVPVCAFASAGTTNTGAVDPLDALADVCREHDVWFHVDGAYGAFAALAPGTAADFAGMGRADSLTLDPHKWLFQPYEAGCLLVRDTGRLEEAFRVLPEYLQDTRVEMQEVNFADRGVQLTRSFRALKVWMSVQTFGVEAFRHAIARSMEQAHRAEAWIREAPELELLSPASLGVVCYRFNPEGFGLDDPELERLNTGIQDRILESGHAMISSTRLRGRYALRLCIMSHRTRWSDIEGLLERVVAHGRSGVDD